MAIAAILAGAIIPIGIRSIQIKAIEKTAEEMRLIQEAANNHYADHAMWPLSIEALKEGGYLDENWHGLNPWQFPYETSSDGLTFSVTSRVPQDLRAMLAGRLSASSLVEGGVVSTIVALRSATIASGIIVAWSGPISDIPQGWVLCDGRNGTPDLRDKFIIGASQDDNAAAKTSINGSLLKEGGSISHDHSGAVGGHILTSRQLPPIVINIPAFSPNQGGMGRSFQRGQDPADGIITFTSNGASEAHAHSIEADEHLPPFYALAFIMRL